MGLCPRRESSAWFNLYLRLVRSDTRQVVQVAFGGRGHLRPGGRVSWIVPQTRQPQVGEVAAKDKHDRRNEVQPQAVEEWTSDHDPHTGQDEKQATEQANPGKQRAVSPPVGQTPSCCHGVSMTCSGGSRPGP